MENILNVILENLPWFWVAVTVISVVIEALTLSLTTIWFAISGFVMVFIAFTPLPFIAQMFIFVVLALVLLIFTRPFLYKKMNLKTIATNYQSVIGQQALVTKRITSMEKGAIKLNGMEWTAAVKGEETLEEGSRCTVDEIIGVTAYVSRHE